MAASTPEPRILITGASGFIGRRLGPALAKAGHLVRSAFRAPRRSADVPECVAVGDIHANTDWSLALRGVDTVVHLAARVHVMHETESEPLSAFRRVNVDGSLNLAKQAAAQGVKRLVFLSSIKVNGERTRTGQVFSERDPARPQDHYARSKWEAEQGLRDLAANCSMAVTIIRPPLVYGPGVRGNLAALMRLVRTGCPLPFGSIHNQRSLIAVDNLVDFIGICIRHPAAADETFLISDGEDMSTPDLIRRLAVSMGRPHRLFPMPVALLSGLATGIGCRRTMQRLGDDLRIDSDKACAQLGWRAPVGVDEGLRLMVSAPWS